MSFPDETRPERRILFVLAYRNLAQIKAADGNAPPEDRLFAMQ